MEDGRLVVFGALGLAHLPQLLVQAAVGDESLDEEAVALPSIQVGQGYVSVLRLQHFLRTYQDRKTSLNEGF